MLVEDLIIKMLRILMMKMFILILKSQQVILWIYALLMKEQEIFMMKFMEDQLEVELVMSKQIKIAFFMQLVNVLMNLLLLKHGQ